MLSHLLTACLLLALQPATLQEAQLWQAINDYRLEQGLPAYQYDNALTHQARNWLCEYPAQVESRIGPGNSVYHYRGAQHAPSGYYDGKVRAENAWMYAPTLRAIMDGWRSVNGWIDSESHRDVLLSDQPCAGLALVYGQIPTPTITPPNTGPLAAVFLIGSCLE